ncbi:hypothetical protein [Cytobacillus praedii]|uniref:hypothetical protein n=1 Tax=Cytobacillus praedii TaxID=1742358 RepID=UPI0013F45AB0|nr:hypothetical protein [Cytobacillus praedii]
MFILLMSPKTSEKVGHLAMKSQIVKDRRRKVVHTVDEAPNRVRSKEKGSSSG